MVSKGGHYLALYDRNEMDPPKSGSIGRGVGKKRDEGGGGEEEAIVSLLSRAHSKPIRNTLEKSSPYICVYVTKANRRNEKGLPFRCKHGRDSLFGVPPSSP